MVAGLLWFAACSASEQERFDRASTTEKQTAAEDASAVLSFTYLRCLADADPSLDLRPVDEPIVGIEVDAGHESLLFRFEEADLRSFGSWLSLRRAYELPEPAVGAQVPLGRPDIELTVDISEQDVGPKESDDLERYRLLVSDVLFSVVALNVERSVVANVVNQLDPGIGGAWVDLLEAAQGCQDSD